MASLFWYLPLFGFVFVFWVVAYLVRRIALAQIDLTDVPEHSEVTFPTAGEFAGRLLQEIKRRPIVRSGKIGIYKRLQNVVELSDINGNSLGALWEAAHEAVHVYQQRAGLLFLWTWVAFLLAAGGIVGWWFIYRSHHNPTVMFLPILASIFVWAVEDLDATKKAEAIILSSFSLDQSQKDQLRRVTKLTYVSCFERPAVLAFLVMFMGFAVFVWLGVHFSG